MQTIRQLAGMGHFDQEKIMPDIKPVSNELVDINWPLEEQASDQFNIAGGWGSGTFVGSVGITLNNLSVRNFFKKGAWRPYPMGAEPEVLDLGADQRNLLQGAGHEFHRPVAGRAQTQLVHAVGTPLGTEQRLLFLADLHAALPHDGRRRRSGQAPAVARPQLLVLRRGLLRALRAEKLGLLRDEERRGQHAGFEVRALAQHGQPADLPAQRFGVHRLGSTSPPPYSLWDGKDYADANLPDEERYHWIEYHKWQLKSKWFFPLTNNQNLVLMAAAEMGYLGHYNKNKVSPFERFEVGGDGMSGYNMYGIDIIAVRGYEEGALDPSNNYSVAYNKYTMELRYPVILKPSSQIYVLGFLEGANAFDSWKQFSPFKIKRAAGFGVRLYLPVVGMLGIDWGYGFDAPANQTGKSGSQIHFMMGQQF